MTSRSPGRRTAANTNVFLNFPFARSYEPMLVALVSGLAGHGLTARSVLEVPPNSHRLARLLAIIRQCGASVHDLSWVTLDRGLYPRFNMPFELGMAASLSNLEGEEHRFFVLESRNYRLPKTLSDMNGYDPLIHNSDPELLLLKLHGVFRGPMPTTPARLRAVWRAVVRSSRLVVKDYGTLFSAAGFAALVVYAKEAAAQVR